MRFLYTYLAKLLLKCNRAARYPSSGRIDLSGARTDTSLGFEGVNFVIVAKGTGVWSMKFQFDDDPATTCEFTSAEISSGDGWELGFADILFSNEAQADVTGPTFYYAWRA